MLQGAVSSPMRTRTATAVGVNADQLPVTSRAAPYTLTTSMVPCGSQATQILMPIRAELVFNGPVQDESFREPPLKISGDADRYNHRDGNDDHRQPATCSG